LFDLLDDAVNIVLLKGAGEAGTREWVVPCVPRSSPLLAHVHVAASPKWTLSMQEQERVRIEHESFAYAAIGPLLAHQPDVIHCLEQEVCNILFDNRHLFARVPKLLFSNGGAIAAADLPRCDFVQEHTERNLAYSARDKAFVIPHGVDLRRFKPGLASPFRALHGIPAEAFVVISVGAVSRTHKRMDHVVREVAAVPGAWLVIVGQAAADSDDVRSLAQQLMPGRAIFTRLPNNELPLAYAAADAFVLGSLFETFGIVYVEAMAMGLPVICSNHPNQRDVVKEGIFVDMRTPGVVTAVLRDTPRERLVEIGHRCRAVAEQHYDLATLKQQYIDRYAQIASAPSSLPTYTWKTRLRAHVNNILRRGRLRATGGRATT
jgi:glycosyltransferase involved in cell wall biosynthesis